MELHSETIAERFAGFDPATLYESAGHRGMVDPKIRPAWAGACVCGMASTVECPPGDNLMLHHAVAAAKHGVVIVATMGGYLLAGAWGEILTVAAQAKGVAGLVADGAVRDIAAISERERRVFSRKWRRPRHCSHFREGVPRFQPEPGHRFLHQRAVRLARCANPVRRRYGAAGRHCGRGYRRLGDRGAGTGGGSPGGSRRAAGARSGNHGRFAEGQNHHRVAAAPRLGEARRHRQVSSAATETTPAGPGNAPRFKSEDLTAFCCAVLDRLDVPPDDARIVADCLVGADLRGVDSHGVVRLPAIRNPDTGCWGFRWRRKWWGSSSKSATRFEEP